MSQLTPSANINALYLAINGQAPGYTVYSNNLGYTSGTALAQTFLTQDGLTDAATALTQVFGNLGLATTTTSTSTTAQTGQAGLFSAMVGIINNPANNISLAYGVNWLVNALATLPSTATAYADTSTGRSTERLPDCDHRSVARDQAAHARRSGCGTGHHRVGRATRASAHSSAPRRA